MKIIFACEIFPPDIGGPATYVEKMASQLKADGHQVVVLTYSRGSHFLDDKKYQFLVFRISRKHHLWLRYFLYFLKLYKLSKKTDLIFAQGPIPSGLPAALVKFLTGKKLIIKVVGDFSWERSRNVYGSRLTIDEFQKQKHSLKIKFIRWLQKIILNYADLVITPSYYLKTIVKGWGVKDKKIKVIYNAVEQIFCSLTKEQAKEKIGVTGDLLISVGRLVPWKGFDFLIKILPKILIINQNFKLLIIGDGPEKDKLEKLINESNLAEQVRLTGQVAHQDLAVYFKAADLFILNTSYEGLSHLLVEALIMELPIITTNIGGNQEVIENNINGLLIDYNNEEQLLAAIKKLYLDQNFKNKLIINSKQTLKKFQFAEMYKKTITSMAQLAQPAAAPAELSPSLLMISGDQDLINGRKGPFYYLLEEFSKYWDSIDVICPINKTLTIEKHFFNKVKVYSCPKNKQAIYQKALAIYQQAKFYIITVHDYPPFRNSQTAIKIKKQLGIPFIIEIHHIIGYPKAADLKEFLLKNYYKIFFKNITKEAKAVRVVNQRQVPDFLINLGIPKEKIIYLPSFYIDQRIFYPQNLEKKYDLLFVGRLVKNKGLDLLIKILELLKSDLPNFKIAIVGKGPEEDWLKLKIKDKELINNVDYLGWLNNNFELAKIYNQTKILLITSDNEGGPRVGLEAMSCGIPVISTKVGIMIDLIKDGENGFLVNWQAEDYVEKIKIILNNPDLAYKFSEQARLVVPSFEYHQLIKNYASTLQKLI